jgi:hypothetical protein
MLWPVLKTSLSFWFISTYKTISGFKSSLYFQRLLWPVSTSSSTHLVLKSACVIAGCLCLVLFLETGPHYVAQAGLELKISRSFCLSLPHMLGLQTCTTTTPFFFFFVS